MNMNLDGLKEQLAQVDLEVQDLEHDPTLAACCIKDMKQNRKSEVLRSHLSQHDPTSMNNTGHAILLAPHLDNTVGDGQSGWSPSSPQEDQQLADIRMQRIQDMKQAAIRQQQQQNQGHGQLVQVAERDLLGKLERQQGYCVYHLSVSGHPACDELDQQLEGLAHIWRGTLFARCVTSRKSHLRPALGLHALPALVCSRNGAVVGRSHLDMFGPAGEEVLEEQVVAYLKRLGMLHAVVPAQGSRKHAGRPRGSSDVSENDDDGDEEEEVGQAACEVCGRRYPHEHVKAVYSSQVESDDEGSEDL